MAIIRIDYTGGEYITDSVDETETTPVIYKSVSIQLYDDSGKSWQSGNFVKDWFDLTKYSLSVEEPISYSSVVDHFIMDGAKFDSAYLYKKENSEDYELFYPDTSKSDWFNDTRLDGLEFFVEENTKPTWLELKEMCK